EHPLLADAAARRFVDEALDRRGVEMADDLRQVVLRVEAVVGEVLDLLCRVAVRVRPAAECQPRLARANLLPQLPRVLDAARAADALVPAEDDERRKAMLPRLLCVREAELQRMFRRQERNDMVVRDVAAEIRREMPQVVLFLRADGAVGEEHADVAP